jgi:DNA-binding NtrC family response regulator
MQLPLIGHPQRLDPFKDFLGFIAKIQGPILITGPTGSGKKRIVDFLLEKGPLNQEPVFHLNGLRFTEDLWGQTYTALKSKGTLVNFEKKATLVYHTFSEYLKKQSG